MQRLCPDSWIDTYLNYTDDQESPKAFHMWVAISLLGAILGRNVWIPRVMYTIYPNMYVILVAGSARCKKSSAIRIGISLMKKLKSHPMIFAQKITNEALIQSLDESKVDGASYGLICASELSVFMGMDAIKSGIIPTLTDLYDSPDHWTYKTRGRGEESLYNVTLSMLAASTKNWLKTSIPIDAVGGGFTSRIIFIHQDRPAKLVLFSPETSKATELEHLLIRDLEEIQKSAKGPVSFTPEAKKLASEWYQKEYNTARDTQLDGYFGRKHDIMFKLAAILSVSERSDLIVDNTHIRQALFLLEENEHELVEMTSSISMNASGSMTEKVFDIIRKHKGIDHSRLLRKCWRFAKATEINEIISLLLDSKEIKRNVEGSIRSYIVVRK